MKINDQSYSLPNLNAESSKRDKTLEKIATAVELGMQDNASRSIADMLQNQISTMSQGLMNLNDGVSMMQIAGGTLNSLSGQTEKLSDLSVRYNSASLNSAQKQELQSEFNRTVESMQQSIDGSTFNGKALFGSNMALSTGEGSITSAVPELSPQSLSIDNQDGIQAYRDSLTQASSQIGSTTNEMVSASDNLLTQISSTAAAKSQIADADLAKVISEYQQSTTKLNIAQIAMAHQHDALKQTIGRLLG